MSNPFPGMNPYLEAPAYWSNVHGRLIAILTDMLDTTLPLGYFANIQERCRVVQTERSIFPDSLVRQDKYTTPRSGRHSHCAPATGKRPYSAQTARALYSAFLWNPARRILTFSTRRKAALSSLPLRC